MISSTAIGVSRKRHHHARTATLYSMKANAERNRGSFSRGAVAGPCSRNATSNLHDAVALPLAASLCADRSRESPKDSGDGQRSDALPIGYVVATAGSREWKPATVASTRILSRISNRHC